MPPGSPLPPPPPLDPLLQARLDRLAAGRTTTAPPVTGRTTAATGRRRKRHAAGRARVAAGLMSIAATAGLAAYFQHADAVGASATPSTAAAAVVGPTTAVSPVTTPSTSGSSVATTNAASTPTTPVTAAAAASNTLADGTYAGSTDTNKWGPVQVQVTVSGGRITGVVALQTPTDDRKSVSINQRATPTLATETLAAQSAQIDTVSGATYTSDSYQVSLQSAIDLARAAAVQGGATS
jgi:uncharacterized protein with FMN-binding domain